MYCKPTDEVDNEKMSFFMLQTGWLVDVTGSRKTNVHSQSTVGVVSGHCLLLFQEMQLRLSPNPPHQSTLTCTKKMLFLDLRKCKIHIHTNYINVF